MNALFFAQDVGSAQFLGPVVRALVGEQRPLRVFARLGGEVGFDGEGVDFQRLDTRPEGMDPVEAREWLSSMNPDLLVCGASGPRPDLTACNLTLAARLLSIPCAGFLDHWKGWNRFAFQGDSVRFLPRRLGVPDSRSLSCLAGHGVPEDRMFIAGHPWLEARRTRPLDSKLRASVRARLEAGDDEPVLVLVSQPLPGGSAHSLSKARLRGKSLPDLLAEAFTSVAGGGVRVLRPHPREASSFDGKAATGPSGWIVDGDSSPEELLCAADALVGLDSLLLVEGALRGVPTLSLGGEAVGYDNPCFFGLGLVKVAHAIESERGLEDALAATLNGHRSVPPTLEVKDALSRCLELLKEMSS